MRSNGRVRGREGLPDRFKHPVHVVANIHVPKAQDSVSFVPQKGVAALVMRAAGMVRPVCLDNQPAALADEVSNIRPYGLLPPKLRAFHLAISQCIPKPHFFICYISPEALRLAKSGLGIACHHAPSPSHAFGAGPSLSLKGRG